MNKLLVAVEQQTYTRRPKRRCRQYLTKEWLPAVKATIRPSTYNSYVQHVECHIAPHIGSVKLQKLSGSQINALYAKLAESGKQDGKHGLSPQTIHHVHACLHKACKDAVRWGQLSRNPLDAADPPRAKGDGSREMHTWTKEQLKAFLEARQRRTPLPSLAHHRHDRHAPRRGDSACAGSTSTSRPAGSRCAAPSSPSTATL